MKKKVFMSIIVCLLMLSVTACSIIPKGNESKQSNLNSSETIVTNEEESEKISDTTSESAGDTKNEDEDESSLISVV